MQYKLILFLLFLVSIARITVFCVRAKHIDNATFPTGVESGRIQTDIATFVLVNPRQVQRAEIIIKKFLSRLTGPVNRQITLRSSSPDGNGLQQMIKNIGKIIRAKIMEFARACRLTTSVRQITEDSVISEDWFSESLIQGSLLLHDLMRMSGEVWFAIDHYFKTYNITLHKIEELPSVKPVNSFQFLRMINDVTGYSDKLFKCLLSIRESKERDNRQTKAPTFDLHRAIANLTRGTPASTLKAFKSRLDRSFSYSTSNNDTYDKKLYMLLCHSLVEKANHYVHCIRELRRFDRCTSSMRQYPDKVTADALPAKPWLIAIQDLSGCKIYIETRGGANVRCNLRQRVPRTTMRQVKYIYEKILDRRISERSLLHRVANELGNALSRNRWGRQFAYDVCRYFVIYQEGHRKLDALSRNAANDKETAIRYKKISHSLSLYKNGVLRKVMIAIGNIHRSVLELQKFLIQDIRISLNDTWQNHIMILVCMSEWMKKLLELFGCTQLDDTNVDRPIPTDVLLDVTEPSTVLTDDNFYNGKNQMKYYAIYPKKNQIREETDKAFERLMISMNHVSRVRNGNHRSTLACLANNLLLVTMFMETISFISTLFCLGKDKKESNFEEVKDEWISPGRKRGSLYLANLEEIDVIKKDFSMIIGVSREMENIHNKKRSVLYVPIEAHNFCGSLRISSRNKNNNSELTKPIFSYL